MRNSNLPTPRAGFPRGARRAVAGRVAKSTMLVKQSAGGEANRRLLGRPAGSTPRGLRERC